MFLNLLLAYYCLSLAHIAYHQDSTKISMAHGLQSIIPTKHHCGFSCPGIHKSTFQKESFFFHRWLCMSQILRAPSNASTFHIVCIHIPYYPMFVLRSLFFSVPAVFFESFLCCIFRDPKILKNNTHLKFYSSPLGSYHPKKEHSFPTIQFQGRAVKLRRCNNDKTNDQTEMTFKALWSLRFSCHLGVANHHRDVLVGKLPFDRFVFEWRDKQHTTHTVFFEGTRYEKNKYIHIYIYIIYVNKIYIYTCWSVRLNLGDVQTHTPPDLTNSQIITFKELEFDMLLQFSVIDSATHYHHYHSKTFRPE